MSCIDDHKTLADTQRPIEGKIVAVGNDIYLLYVAPNGNRIVFKSATDKEQDMVTNYLDANHFTTVYEPTEYIMITPEQNYDRQEQKTEQNYERVTS
jgi:hypothetical protein